MILINGRFDLIQLHIGLLNMHKMHSFRSRFFDHFDHDCVILSWQNIWNAKKIWSRNGCQKWSFPDDFDFDMRGAHIVLKMFRSSLSADIMASGHVVNMAGRWRSVPQSVVHWCQKSRWAANRYNCVIALNVGLKRSPDKSRYYYVVSEQTKLEREGVVCTRPIIKR